MKRHVFSPGERVQDLVAREEKLYRDGVRAAAERILNKNARFVFLAGPSCSGKTTTSLSLIRLLEDKGKRVFTFSTDDFFSNEDQAELFEDGTPDFDAFSFTDSDYIRRALSGLAKNEKVTLPFFDFIKGKRADETVTVLPGRYDVFILEGIHALNDRILSALPESEARVCVYLNTTCGVGMEGSDAFFTPEEVRLCRRIIRDYKHRGASAEWSFTLWAHVVQSEKEVITPFKKNAEIVLSTDFSYEPAVARRETSKRLSEVAPSSRWYGQAQSLLKKYEAFPALGEDLVPKDSVLQEFLAD